MSEKSHEDEDMTATTDDDSEPRYSEEDLPPAGAGSRTPEILAEIRGDPFKSGVGVVVAAVVGVGLAWFHWAGLFVAGALVGLFSETVPRAVVAGFIVGVLVLVVQVGVSPVMGAGEFVALSPPSYVAVAAGLLMPIWGSLIRGVI